MIRSLPKRRTSGSREAFRDERSALTLPEVATVLAVVVCLLAVAVPFAVKSWEASRQVSCRNRLRALGQAVTSFQKEHNRFPAGQVALKYKSDDIGRYADPDEARSTDGRASGASWMVAVLPHLGETASLTGWQDGTSVVQNASIAQKDIAAFYCPSRRGSMSASRYSGCERLTDTWRTGGNDYAGCSGSGITFNDTARQTYALTDAQVATTLRGGLSAMSSFAGRRGILSVNSRVTAKDVQDADGLAWVILIAERRLSSQSTPNELRSSDGWAWGGPATLFSTRYAPHGGQHFSEADSEHPNLINLCMADTVVRRVNWNIDLRAWNDLGSYADARPINHPDFRR